MNNKHSFSKFLILILLFTYIGYFNGFGAVTINFSGGAGSALTMTVPNDVTFTGLTLNNAQVAVVVINANAGNTTTGTFSHTGTSDLAGVNNSGTGSMGYVNFAGITDEDVFAIWFNGDINDTGGSVVLSAGTRTTTGVLNGLAPSSGSYTIRLANANTGAFIGNEGTQAVPEPHHYALLSGASLGLFALWRMRLKNKCSA